MKSSDRSDHLELDRGLPTTAADRDALRRAKAGRLVGLDGYLRFLSQLPQCAPGELRAKRGLQAAGQFTID